MLVAFIALAVAISCTTGLPPVTYTGETETVFGETFNEIPCLIVGGICVKTTDCPEGKRSEHSGLCPLQQRVKVECCHSLPLSEKRCHYRGGICMAHNSSCPEHLTFKEARDCELDEKCCILVN